MRLDIGYRSNGFERWVTTMLAMLAVTIVCALVTLAVMPTVIRRLRAHAILDVPNARSSHSIPLPRGGGLAILGVGLLAQTVLLAAGDVRPTPVWWGLTIPMLALAGLGFLDDLRSLGITARLLVQGAAAAWAVWLAGLARPSLQLPLLPAVDLGPFGPLLSWLWIVGFTNAFNFMDGINGLAGFQALLASLALAVLAAAGGDLSFALLAAAVAGGSLGFLRYNFPNARVFLGDVGSQPIGFFLAFGVLHAARVVPGPHPFVLTLLVVWPFLFDAVFTLCRRAILRRHLGNAHRDHLYQLLVRGGLTHGAVTAAYVAVIVGCAGFALLVRLRGAQAAAAGFYGVVGFSLAAAVLIIRFHARRTSSPASPAIAVRSAVGAAAGQRLPDAAATRPSEEPSAESRLTGAPRG